jgi:hypothetical protein
MSHTSHFREILVGNIATIGNHTRVVLSLKFRPHMVTRTQHRQTVMKSSMDLN